jgi:hypothetical protein
MPGQPIFYRTQWLRAKDLHREQFKALLSRPSTAALFDDKFFSALEARRVSLANLHYKLLLIQIPVFLFLVLTIVPTAPHIAVFGITGIENFREVLLFIASTIGLVSIFIFNNMGFIDDILEFYAEWQARDEPRAKTYLAARYQFVWFLHPIGVDPDRNVSPLTALAVLLVGLLLALVAALLVFSLGIIEIFVIIDIFKHPTFPAWVTYPILVYALLVSFLAVMNAVFNSFWLPHRNFSNARAFLRLKKTDPKRFEAIRQQILSSGHIPDVD